FVGEEVANHNPLAGLEEDYEVEPFLSDRRNFFWPVRQLHDTAFCKQDRSGARYTGYVPTRLTHYLDWFFRRASVLSTAALCAMTTTVGGHQVRYSTLHLLVQSMCRAPHVSHSPACSTGSQTFPGSGHGGQPTAPSCAHPDAPQRACY